MYRQFFGFTNEVFSKELKEQQLFNSESFKEVINRFEYMKKYRGIMLVTGDPGTGKTSSIRYFISNLSAKSFLPVYIPLATVAVGDFYRQLNTAIHGEQIYGKSNVYRAIQRQITNLAVNRSLIPVIIFDEAHLLKDQNFNELQIITNFKYDTLCPAIIILSGQSVLKERMRGYNLVSFNQRIALKYHLGSLSQEETKKYILHHFKICNCSEEILTDAGFTAVYNISKGIPRVIGNIVTMSLMLAANKKEKTIDEDMVITASQEI